MCVHSRTDVVDSQFNELKFSNEVKMSTVEERLKSEGLEISECPIPMNSYIPAKRAGNFVFASGQCSIQDGKLLYSGKIGDDIDESDGYKSAAIAALRCISTLRSVADLDKLSIVKVNGYVQGIDNFANQAAVVNGASDLFVKAFGQRGRHARVALGIAGLPLNASVEIEVIAYIEE